MSTLADFPSTAVQPDRAPGVSPPLSFRELLLLLFTCAATFIGTCSILQGWTRLIFNYGDNPAYLYVANAIAHWDFHNVGIQHFMGYPYFIAAFAKLLHIPLMASLVLVAWSATMLASILTARMFGTWVAAYFALTNFAWIQLSFLGGSEPLAVALGLGAFWAFRRNRPILAALLGSLAVVVRPLMLAVLVGIGLALLIQKKYREFLKVFLTSLVIGVLYMATLAIYYGDPLLTVHSYTTRDYGATALKGPHGHLFSWPFHGIVMGTLLYPAPWTNLVVSFFWIFLVLAGVCLMFRPAFRRYAAEHPAEVIFSGVYLLAIYSYDYFVWARSNFIRFAIPVLPIIFLALLPYLPKRRAIVWVLAVVTPVLAALSAMGVRNVVPLP
jgi:hypothetical protein